MPKPKLTKTQKKETVVIKGRLPNEMVDRHLKMYGHLPNTKLCDDKGSCQNGEMLGLIRQTRTIIEKRTPYWEGQALGCLNKIENLITKKVPK